MTTGQQFYIRERILVDNYSGFMEHEEKLQMG